VSWFGGGYVGVDVFFVISGFLITGLLLREHEKRKTVSIAGFYARRARRILPAGMLVIIATIVWSYHTVNFVDYATYAIDGKWASLFAANIHFANGVNYFNQGMAPSPLLHYWSLAVEEQFYFVWPTLVLVVGLLTRRIPIRLSVFVAALVATIASYWWADHASSLNATWAYYSPWTRGWELGIGAIAATCVAYAARLPRWAGFALAWAGMIAIVVSSHIYGPLTVFPGPAALLPVLGAVAVIVGGASGIGASHALSLPPVRAVGRVSYGWYLLHYPPMILLIGALPSSGPLPVHERLLIAAVTLVVAFIMYALLEKPIRRSRQLAVRPWASIAMGLTFVAAAFLVSALLQKGFSY
jgi:peptidoglycan/LPS O-acetylase OafA/YrhL